MNVSAKHPISPFRKDYSVGHVQQERLSLLRRKVFCDDLAQQQPRGESSSSKDHGISRVRKQFKNLAVNGFHHHPNKADNTNNAKDAQQKRHTPSRLPHKPFQKRASKVRFQLDRQENIDTTSSTVIMESHNDENTMILSTEDVKNLWWSRRELAISRERAQETCRVILSSGNPDFRNAAMRLLDACGAQRYDDNVRSSSSSSSCSSSSSSIASTISTEQSCDSTTTTTTTEDDIAAVLEKDARALFVARGLEKRIVNALNLPFHRHKKSIYVVLDTQDRLETMRLGSFTKEQKMNLIANQYSLNARFAVVWARGKWRKKYMLLGCFLSFFVCVWLMVLSID
jgi:hypothetical protein